MQNFFSILSTLFFTAFAAVSQTTVTIKAGSVFEQGPESGPIYRPSATSNIDYSQYAYLYTAGELNAIPAGTYISSIAWNKTNVGATTLSGGGKCRIYLKNSMVASYDLQFGKKFTDFISDATLVYSNNNTAIPAIAGYVPFSFTTPFLYTGGNLEVMVDWDISSVAGSPTSSSFIWERTTTTKKIYGIASAAPIITDFLKPAGDSTGTITNTRPIVRFTLNGELPNCTEPPSGGAVLAPDSLCKGVNIFLTVTGASNGAKALSYQWQSSPNNFTWTNIGSMSDDSIMISQSTETYYRRITTCANTSDTSGEKLINIKQYNDAGCVCIPTLVNCLGNYYIARVQLGTLDNNSGCSIGSYVNYSDSTGAPEFLLTTSKFLTVNIVSSATGTRYLQTWIDFNHDGIFNESSYFWSSTTNTFTGTITLPANAFTGLTRMRIRYVASSTNPGACGGNAFTAGETEDYLINIVDFYACTTSPVNDITIASVPAVCTADSVLLSTSGANAAATYSYQWQSSRDSIVWQDMQLFKSPTCVVYQDSTRFYRTRIGCADQYVYTAPVKVLMKPWIKCYCKVYRTYCSNNLDAIKRVVFGTLDHTSGCSPGGYIDYADSVAAPSVQSGTGIPISVTVSTDNYVDVWIDYNMNGEFDLNEHTSIGGGSKTSILNDTINIPAGIGGLTKMRVRDRFYYGSTNSWDACNFLSGGFSYGETEDYLINIIGPKHCLPAGSSNCSNGDVITRVVFGTIDTTTTCSLNGFGDFTKGLQSNTIAANTYVPLSVQAACVSGNTESVGVWIDFNQNGVYERNEFTLVGRDCGTISNNISIPTNALQGLTTMRIRATRDIQINPHFNPRDACIKYVNGETEEYNIIVEPYSTCPTNTWTGLGGNNNWDNAANWSCQQIPGVHSNVVINSGTVVISSNVTIYSLNVNPSATVTVEPPFDLVVTH
jgi:hypothetical protein